MIEIPIPGYKILRLEHLVLDHNGTLAVDGLLVDGVAQRLHKLSESLSIHVVTADTFGKARMQLTGVPCELTVLKEGAQDAAKQKFVRQLGAEGTVCMGNGRNDRLMLQEAALGIAVILKEGAAVQTLAEADVVCTSITAALDLLLNPLRLTATLRS
jgi:soluble P-type ATPase